MERDRPRRRIAHHADHGRDSRPWSPSVSDQGETAGRRQRHHEAAALQIGSAGVPAIGTAAPDEARSRAVSRSGLRAGGGCLLARAHRRRQPTSSAASANSVAAGRACALASIALSGPPPYRRRSHASRRHARPQRDDAGAVLARRRRLWMLASRHSSPDPAAVRKQPRHPGLRRVAQPRHDGVEVVADRRCRRAGARVVEVNQGSPALLGARDGGVEPAVAILGGAAEPVVVDDDVFPLASPAPCGR